MTRRDEVSDNLERELSELEAKGEGWVAGGMSDRNVRPAIILLTKAVLHLDNTSARLAKVNIWLTIAMLIVAGLQVAVVIMRK